MTHEDVTQDDLTHDSERECKLSGHAGMTLDDRLRGHCSTWTLDSASVAELLESTRVASRAFYRRHVLWAVAASVLVFSSIAVHHITSISERTDRTVREAAMNHGTRLTLEFDTDQIATLDEAMFLLPFEIRRPDRLDEGWTLLGGRYCSLAGHLAVHLKLVAVDGDETRSLFVTRAADDLDFLEGEQQRVDGVDVNLWAERGLFFAMARDAS